MMLLAFGCSFKTTPVELREKLVLTPEMQRAALEDLCGRFGCEAVVLSTCNRLEFYLARAEDTSLPGVRVLAEFLAERCPVDSGTLLPHLYLMENEQAARQLFRVTASLDSLVVGEGQIAGQVKQAYELAQACGAIGPLLHSLFQKAHQAAKRVRTETGISRGHVSVSSVAVDYVREVFDTFDDKTILVIGAGKMGELTLRHLRQLEPKQILVANRSPEKAQLVARGCGGTPVAWQELDEAIIEADIVLSTTGAAEPIVSATRYKKIDARREGRPIVILDIAVPRDFDPAIHDGDRTCLFNIDDLEEIRQVTLDQRLQHVPTAEAIITEEVDRFLQQMRRRRLGPIITRLTQDCESKREKIVQQVLAKMNGKLSKEERDYLEGAFRLMQNQFLHGPISALTNEPQEEESHSLLDAIRKLFRL